MEDIYKDVFEIMKRHFKPEFINRVDDIVVFKPLSEDVILKIARIFIDDVASRLKERFIKLDITDEALKYIAKEGYDPVFGARPLKRFIQKTVENTLAREIIKGNISEGQKVLIDLDGENIVCKSV